ncbi:Wee1-like protein kinase 1-B [Taenia crassiceps]
MQRKQRGDALSDLNQRCYARLSERTASEVKRHVMCEEATPPLVQMKCCNRYACAHSDEGARRTADFVDHAWLSNGSSLVKAYSTLHELCRTDSAVVYSARHRQTGVVYCIKRSLRRPCAVDRCDDAVQNALNECQALSVLRHTNIVRFHNSWIESGSVMLQMEYCLGGSLHDCLHGRATTHTAPLNPLCPGFGDGGAAAYQEREGDTRRTAIHGLPVTALTKLLGDVASALEYMHTKWYMAHRNVGMRTILVQLKPHAVYRAYRSEEEMEDARRQCHELLHSGGTAEMDFKLAGFGVASRVSEAADSRSGDVYALGVTLCFAARGDELPHPDNEVNEVDTSTVPASLQPILQLMLRPLAVDRVTASGVLEYLVAAHSGGDETEEMDVH